MWMTPETRKPVGPVIQPFLTPRPERRSRVTDSSPRPLDFGTNPHVNVQVLLRCRPLSDEEQRLNVAKVITCNEQKREVAVLQNVANKQVDKFFTFDKVFGPKAQQRSIYEQAIFPVVNEVLEGFNCTIFAYGQTGTGKTYTMEGEMRNKGGELPTEAGVIPRAVRQIFDTLEAQNADYSMKVTFLELYNEEIVDLLAPEDYARSLEERQKKPVSLMEDGNGCVLVRGLEEEAVYSATDIYNLLERGAAKRRTADTLLNKRSSRSHSVFTITVHIKQANLGNEEVIKYGKLNLVDLAGSENISRSGAREGRAKEAGEINKSLLTLGRVINALVEHSGHVPYRDSKLTRLLRDSLGGKTKTCIIATISPSAHCLEETLSTLDYARRAKNIKNRPEANQKMSKAMLLKDLYLEMEKMKQDLRAARERNGVYIPHERFAQDEAEKKAKNEKIEELEIDLNISKKKLDEYHELYLSEQQKRLTFENDLKDCMINLENSNKALQDVQVKYSESTSLLKQKEFIISRLLDTENCLIDHAKQLRGELQNASEDISALFSKIDYKSKLEAQNQGLLLTFGSQLDRGLNDLHKTVLGTVSQQQQQLRSMEEHVISFLASKSDKTEVLESRIRNITETYTSGLAAVKMLGEMLQMKASSDLEHAKSKISSHVVAVEKFFENAISEAKNTIYGTQNSINEQKQMLAFSMQQQKESLFRSLVSANMISKATIDFFNDLRERAITVMAVIEEGHNKKLHQMAAFEKAFKEDAAREEKLAMEKIAAILGNLTAKKSDMVSEASRNITDLCSQQRKILQEEMSMMQQVSDVAKGEVNEYIEKVKNQFIEDTFASNENSALMENCLQECGNDMDTSMRHWDNSQSAINGLNKCSIAETELMLSEKNCENNIKREEITSRCLFTEAQLKTKTSELMLEIHDSLMLDREIKKEFDSLANICLDQLTCLSDRHGVSMKNLQNRTEQCLTKDYLVDQNNSVITPRRREVKVPSLASIEEMRTPAAVAAHVHSGTPLKCIQNGNIGNKIDQGQEYPSVDASPNRIPFADLN